MGDRPGQREPFTTRLPEQSQVNGAALSGVNAWVELLTTALNSLFGDGEPTGGLSLADGPDTGPYRVGLGGAMDTDLVDNGRQQDHGARHLVQQIELADAGHGDQDNPHRQSTHTCCETEAQQGAIRGWR